MKSGTRSSTLIIHEIGMDTREEEREGTVPCQVLGAGEARRRANMRRRASRHWPRPEACSLSDAALELGVVVSGSWRDEGSKFYGDIAPPKSIRGDTDIANLGLDYIKVSTGRG